MAETKKTTELAAVPDRVVLVEKQSTGYRPMIKKVGMEPNIKDEKKAITFFSEHKSFMVYTEDGFIEFQNQMYRTDNKEDIEFLRNHSSFGTDFWEGRFPDYIIKKFEKNKEYLTRSEDVFNIPEE